MTVKVCKWCKKEFTTKSRKAQYCSDDCRYTAKKESRKKTIEHKNRLPKYSINDVIRHGFEMEKILGRYVGYTEAAKDLENV